MVQGLKAPATQPATAQQFQEVEERMTAFERSTVRWTRVAVGVSILAAILICAQWYEMHTGATDTHDLAKAANRQADKAETISDNLKKAAEQMERSANQAEITAGQSAALSKATLDATIAQNQLDQRAWVGVSGAELETLEVGQSVKATITLINSGKTLARGVKPIFWFGFSESLIRTEDDLGTEGYHSAPTSLAVLLPGSKYVNHENSGKFKFTEPEKTRMTADRYSYIWGSVTYRDVFKKPHWTKFCVYRRGTTGDFIQCPCCNDAE